MVSAIPTRNEVVHSRLRADILSGRVSPGEKLAFADLCSYYSVSVGVLREALSRLVEQGLVVSAPQQGFRVASVSTQDLSDLTDARKELESLALRRAIFEGDLEWRSRVVASHYRLSNTSVVESVDPDRLSEEWVEAHSSFHHTLLAGCANLRLVNIASQLRDSAELYRHWSVSMSNELGSRDIEGEHRGIVQAVLAGEVETAVERLRNHIQLTTDLLLASGAVDGRPSPRRDWSVS